MLKRVGHRLTQQSSKRNGKTSKGDLANEVAGGKLKVVSQKLREESELFLTNCWVKATVNHVGSKWKKWSWRGT